MMEAMPSVSIVIPAWNEAERITQCLYNATQQTVAPYEVIVVDNKSTDNTCELVRDFASKHPESNIILMHQDEVQGLIPTRNYGLNHATGEVLGRIDADCMLKPDWVEVVSNVFDEHPSAMGATGPVTYYDMPARLISLMGDHTVRSRVYRADGKKALLFGSNMAVRATAWRVIANEACRDEEDVFHEDIDVSLHLFDHNFRTAYCKEMVCGISARRMDTSLFSFMSYMRRFDNTFKAHPQHYRERYPEITLIALYPMIHLAYPFYQKYAKARGIDLPKHVWESEQCNLGLIK